MSKRAGSWTPAFDYMLALLGIFMILAIVEKPKANPPRIETQGLYAVVVSWAPGSIDDVDTYVQDPLRNEVWFGDTAAPLMHLERDDLGTAVSGTQILPDGRKVVVRANQERVVITGPIAGEYVVNVFMFNKGESRPTKVTIELWRLAGADSMIHTRSVTLTANGQELTAFRFTLNTQGLVTGYSTLYKEIVHSK